ncbi:MAG: ion transporter [Planctomycetes bacterium]|nr:ion transporter [Planctomycetota bacterium]
MNAYFEKIAGLPCWEQARRGCQVQPLQNNGEVVYAVAAAFLIHDGGPRCAPGPARPRGADDKRWWQALRQFAAQYCISFTRQRELTEMAYYSGWGARQAANAGGEEFIDAFIDTCLYDHKLQPVEFRLLHYFESRLGPRPGLSAAENKAQIRGQAHKSKERIRKQFASLKYRAVVFFERPLVATVVTILIVLNAVLLGLLTNDWVAGHWAKSLNGLDTVFLVIFTVEVACRLFAFRREYFKEALNALDFVVILVSWAPFPGSSLASAFRAFRVFRALLLVNRFPKLKLIVKSLENSLPNIGWVSLLLMMFFYVFAVLTTNLFGKEYPAFASIPASLLSLFQLMTLEGWPDLTREVMQRHPWAWLVFVPFMLFSSYIFLNLVVGIIVSTMQEMHENATAETRREIDEIQDVKVALGKLERQVEALRERLAPDAAPRAHDWRHDSGLFHREPPEKG